MQERKLELVRTEPQAANGRFFVDDKSELAVIAGPGLAVHSNEFLAFNELLNPDIDWYQKAQFETAQLQRRIETGSWLGITLTKEMVKTDLYYTSINSLMKDFGAERRNNLCSLIVPGNRISFIKARTFFDKRPGSTILKKLVDVQIKTNSDKPVYVFDQSAKPGQSKMKPIATLGSWFTFDLNEVTLELIN